MFEAGFLDRHGVIKSAGLACKGEAVRIAREFHWESGISLNSGILHGSAPLQGSRLKE